MTTELTDEVRYDEILTALDSLPPASAVGGNDEYALNLRYVRCEQLLHLFSDDIRRCVEAWKLVEEGRLIILSQAFINDRNLEILWNAYTSDHSELATGHPDPVSAVLACKETPDDR